MRKKKKRKKKKAVQNTGGKDMKDSRKGLIVGVTLAILLAMAGGGAFYTYRYYRNLPVFLDGTTLNGEDVSGMTPEQIANRIDREYRGKDVPVLVCEGSSDVLDGMLSQFGYTFIKEELQQKLDDAFAEQHSDLSHIWHALRQGDSLSIETAFSCNEQVLQDKVRVENLSVARTQTVDPAVAFNEEIQRYYVEPGKRGDEIDEQAMQALVKDALDAAVREDSLPEFIRIPLEEKVYCSPEPAGNIEELEAECLSLNKEVVRDTWSDMTVTYTFGNETEVLGYDTFRDWLLIDDDLRVTLDTDKAAAWVADLAGRYDTLYLDRTFTSTTGRTITWYGGQNGYGYSIRQDAELQELAGELLAKQPVARDPVYVTANEWGNPYYLTRNGHDDLCGTYLDIDLSAQHLWFYRDYQLIIETDFVSGTADGKHDTQVGVFPLAYKESPSVLRGSQADGGYEQKVQYWMPFYEGQGLHDANWRGSFGGSIYLYDGSHGCINLPPYAAQTIYENIPTGTAILIYK